MREWITVVYAETSFKIIKHSHNPAKELQLCVNTNGQRFEYLL